MKKFLKLKSIFILMLFASLALSCLNDDNDAPPRPAENIVELASADENLSSLVAALQAADGDLPTVLQGNGPFTVLAPTNAAFDAFLDGQELSDIPTDVLAQVLLNHVLLGEISSSILVANGAGYASTTADGPVDDSKISIYFNTTSGVTFNGTSKVTQNGADILASNGTIHIVDEVIDLPTILTFATLDDRFNSLEGVLTDEIVSSLGTANGTSPAPFTLFAPVNEAFSLLTEVPTGDELTAILLHHVIGDNNILIKDITDGLESPATLEGDVLTFSEVGDLIRITDGSGNNDINVGVANIQATNGVIHSVDKVLIPDTSN